MAVSSRCFAVGAVVPNAKVDVGVVASQARVSLLYGSRGLALLATGMRAPQVVEVLIALDRWRSERPGCGHDSAR